MRLFGGSDISLEDAERVVNAHHAGETAKKAAELRRFIGRFFKRQGGGYSEFLGDDNSWTYGMPRVVSGQYPNVSGLCFRTTRHGTSVIREATLDVDRGGWVEIEASEFWGAAKFVLSELTASLTPVAVEAPS